MSSAPDKKRLMAPLLAASVGALVGVLGVTFHVIPERLLHSGVFTGMLRAHPAIGVSVALWIFFDLYWSIAAKNAAPTERSESRASRQFHLALLMGSLVLLFFPVPGLRGRFLPSSDVLAIIGLTIQAAFCLFAFWARHHLGRNWSGAVTIAKDHKLIRSGPYRRIRHPIYTAMLGMYTGAAIVSGELHALLAVVIITAAYWRKIGMEERNLRQAFGAEHEQYVSESWAIIPPIW